MWKKGQRQGSEVKFFKYTLPVPVIAMYLIAIGCLIRLVYLGGVPGGMNQDEAYAGYEAYSMLHSGTDSWGYAFPVYFTSWGSGMNVLESYLMMPFVAVFGLCPLAVRLPQAIVACFSLVVFYRLFRRLFDDKVALAGLFLLTICPWHIMMARWGLESNLAPGFLLFGLYFFVLGQEDSRKYMLSALFYGLSLYAYATIWTLVPMMLVLQLAYLLYVKKIKFDRYLVLSVLILAVLALPLILFLLINMGYMEEVKTSFFSIPKLLSMRNGEVSLKDMPENFGKLWDMLMSQNDGLYWNTTPKFGLYYKGVLAFAVLGGIYCLKRTVQSLRKRVYDGAAFLLISFVCTLLLGCMISVNANRINSIHIGIVGFCGIGLYLFIKYLGKEFAHIGELLAAVFCAAFFLFTKFYFTEYEENISVTFNQGLGEAVEYVKEAFPEEEVHVSASFSHSLILFYDKTPVQEYMDTVQYSNYPSPYLAAKSFGRYRFDGGTGYAAGVSILPAQIAAAYEQQGYGAQYFDSVGVVWK